MSSIVFPDVCKTPAPGGPIPVPYPIIASGPSNPAQSSKKVKIKPTDKGFAQHMDNLRAAGDADAGAANGVASALKLQKTATGFLNYSFNVKVEGAISAVLMGRGLMHLAPHKRAPAGAEIQTSQTARLSR